MGVIELSYLLSVLKKGANVFGVTYIFRLGEKDHVCLFENSGKYVTHNG